MAFGIYLLNHSCVELVGLKNNATEVVDEGASVSVTIKTRSGSVVAGQNWPLAMPHVADGKYRGTLEPNLSLSPGRDYVAHIDVVGSGGEVGHWAVPITALVRKQ